MEDTEVKVEEENQNNEPSTQDNQEIDYKALYEEKSSKVSELEGLIQKHKTKAKEEPKDGADVNIDDLLNQKLAEKDFYNSNPDMLEYKDQINEFTSKGLTHTQAKNLVIDSNPDIVNRKNTNKANFTNGSPSFNVPSYTKEELGEMSQEEYNKTRDLIDKGKAQIKS